MTAINDVCANRGIVDGPSADALAARATTMMGDVKNSVTIEANEAERMIARLETSGRYRVLRRLEARAQIHTPDGTPTRRGIFLDVETTGLNPAADEVIELAMIPFDFADDGRIFAVHQPFSRFRDPGRPIPAAITVLTGITDAMVAGASIGAPEIEAFLAPATLVIAHNAGFDRPFCEKFCSDFAATPWACSWREVQWADEGFDSARLGHLALGHRLFFDGHRALDDCRAGLEILSRPLPRSGRTALAVLLESARRPNWRIRAVGAPFAARTALKTRGYRWNDGSNGGARAWFVDAAEDALETESEFLRSQIYRRENAAIDARRFTAVDRYSERCR